MNTGYNILCFANGSTPDPAVWAEYSSIEDVAVLSFEEPCYPAIEDKSFVSTPVLKALQTIILVQENQKLFENSEQTYDVWLTRGIIFDFGDHQFSFEKAVWFSEEIKIRKGYNLIEEFCPTNDFCNNKNRKEGITAECFRTTEFLCLAEGINTHGIIYCSE